MLFGQKRMYPEDNSGRECCWPYLIGQHPLSPVFGQKRPGTPGNSYGTLLSFHPFLAILCFFPVGYSTARTDQHGPQELFCLPFCWCPCMAINVSVQYDGGFFPDIILLTQYYYHRVTRLNAMKRFCIFSY